MGKNDIAKATEPAFKMMIPSSKYHSLVKMIYAAHASVKKEPHTPQERKNLNGRSVYIISFSEATLPKEIKTLKSELSNSGAFTYDV
jgi:hypothetical protein